MNNNDNLPVEGQDFANPEDEQNQKSSAHGEVANQKGSDFTELEESRMDNPPKHREDNGSGEEDVPDTGKDKQRNGVA